MDSDAYGVHILFGRDPDVEPTGPDVGALHFDGNDVVTLPDGLIQQTNTNFGSNLSITESTIETLVPHPRRMESS